jgi:hypothetical protein
MTLNAWCALEAPMLHHLQVALLARGYYSGDNDVQSWIFGEGTAEALAQFQSDNKLPATGKSHHQAPPSCQDAASNRALLCVVMVCCSFQKLASLQWRLHSLGLADTSSRWCANGDTRFVSWRSSSACVLQA